MKKMGVLGSCLAGMTSVLLAGDYRWVRLNNAAVDRSDVFARYFVRQEPMPSREIVEMVLAVKPEHADEAKPVFDRMFRNGVGLSEMPVSAKPLIDNLANERFDVFVLDNQCDTYVLKSTYESLSGNLDFESSFPLHWCERWEMMRDSFRFAPCLEPAESARNWAEIVRYLRSAQPQARIFFLCAPSSPHENDAARRARADAFEPALRAALGDTEIDIVPQLQVPRELTKLPDDPEHFDLLVYRALAGRIFTSFFTAPGARTQPMPAVADAA
jgi:hypothetical protein